MRFAPSIFQSYDTSLDSGSFTEFFDGIVAGRAELPPALSGLKDLRFQLSINEEHARATCPRVEFTEKEPQAPGIFRDGDGNPATFSRRIELSCTVKEEARKFFFKDGQSFFEQPFTIWIATLVLAKADYLPAAGDVFRWRDTWRQVTAVKVDPSDYFGATGFPLYFRIESAMWVPELGMDGVLPCSPRDGAVVVSSIGNRMLPIADEVYQPSGIVANPAQTAPPEWMIDTLSPEFAQLAEEITCPADAPPDPDFDFSEQFNDALDP